MTTHRPKSALAAAVVVVVVAVVVAAVVAPVGSGVPLWTSSDTQRCPIYPGWSDQRMPALRTRIRGS